MVEWALELAMVDMVFVGVGALLLVVSLAAVLWLLWLGWD
jgi:hypothetical protein